MKPLCLLGGCRYAKYWEEYRDRRQHGAIDHTENAGDVRYLEQPPFPLVPFGPSRLFQTLVVGAGGSRAGENPDFDTGIAIRGASQRRPVRQTDLPDPQHLREH
eukprot:CAMPEP_0197721018 /NCGR_PEP_ID=MMETSP1434-20131217/4202_1 /TAXON_ID=265543 /ORGANISM="Minutocellus polymorphus, Strain CCMP3303" /LENGTH=103 /DNA_ID=CAMNT_0043305957 /DNA_START=134 /DNA_END=445 /DNA_ORIENTATION=-